MQVVLHPSLLNVGRRAVSLKEPTKCSLKVKLESWLWAKVISKSGGEMFSGGTSGFGI